MLPPVTGTFTPAPPGPTVAARAERGAHPSAGETAAAVARPETPERVDPPRTLPATARLPEDRRREALLPPDPDPPTGPPPAFDATPLDRARATAMAAVDLLAEVPDGEPPRNAEGPGAAPSAAPDPPRPALARDLIQKVVAEVTDIRRMADPAPDRTLDVTR